MLLFLFSSVGFMRFLLFRPDGDDLFLFFSVFFEFLVVQARQSGDDLHLGSEGLACSLHMEAEESKVRENLGGRGLAIYEFKNWIRFNFTGVR